jgi:hypothetical protein
MDGLIKKVLMGTIAIVFGIYLIPVGIEALAGTNTTNWTKITGGAGAVAIFGILGLVFVGGFAYAMLSGWIGTD